MGLRLLAILLLVHAALGPALAIAREARPAPASAAVCCAEACSCEDACPCAASDDSERPVPDQTPATPPRGGEEPLRHLTLVGARVIDRVPTAVQIATPIVIDRARSLPPAAFRGATAQASLCVRTT